MDMKLSNLEFIKLLPQFMREDGAVKGLSLALDIIIPELDAAIKRLPTWGHIDQLSEAELDALAWELNISWYDYGASMEIKRQLVKDSDIIHKHLGTKWAVEHIINTFFGEGFITEWFEYSGEPGHFRVYSTNPSLSEERMDEFLNVLGKVKRASSILDGIFITLTGRMTNAAGFAYHEAGRDLYEIGGSM